MGAALAILLQIASPTPPAEDEVVVIGRKLSNLSIVLKRRRGEYYCKYKRRSGDAALDTAACTASIDCYVAAKTRDEMKTCIVTAVTALVHPTPPQ